MERKKSRINTTLTCKYTVPFNSNRSTSHFGTYFWLFFISATPFYSWNISNISHASGTCDDDDNKPRCACVYKRRQRQSAKVRVNHNGNYAEAKKPAKSKPLNNFWVFIFFHFASAAFSNIITLCSLYNYTRTRLLVCSYICGVVCNWDECTLKDCGKCQFKLLSFPCAFLLKWFNRKFVNAQCIMSALSI